MGWKGPYINAGASSDDVLHDAFGRPYEGRRRGQVRSAGPDGVFDDRRRHRLSAGPAASARPRDGDRQADGGRGQQLHAGPAGLHRPAATTPATAGRPSWTTPSPRSSSRTSPRASTPSSSCRMKSDPPTAVAQDTIQVFGRRRHEARGVHVPAVAPARPGGRLCCPASGLRSHWALRARATLGPSRPGRNRPGGFAVS